ncbi:hypothetical protein J2Y67_004885 [Neobacillus niacini]|nr:hypothetical protein [Neobacillus niacini]
MKDKTQQGNDQNVLHKADEGQNSAGKRSKYPS